MVNVQMKKLVNILKMPKKNNVNVLIVQRKVTIMRINIVLMIITNVILNVLVFGSMINKINVYVDYKIQHAHHQ